jgi:hypothetical protein
MTSHLKQTYNREAKVNANSDEETRWETVCTTMSEMVDFANSLDKEDKQERELMKIIREELLPPLEERLKQMESSKKKLERMVRKNVQYPR